MTDLAMSFDCRPNIIVRLWRGDVPLGRTYWLYGVVGGLVLRGLSVALNYEIGANIQQLSAFDLSAIGYASLAVSVAFGVLIVVAVWRSANQHAAAGRSKAQARLAQVVTLFGACTLLLSTLQALTGSDDPSLPANKAASLAMIQGMNAGLPRKVDDVTTLQRISFDRSTLTYIYAITVPIADRTTFESRMKAAVVKNCGVADIKAALKAGTSMEYVYAQASTGAEAGRIRLSLADCPAP